MARAKGQGGGMPPAVLGGAPLAGGCACPAQRRLRVRRQRSGWGGPLEGPRHRQAAVHNGKTRNHTPRTQTRPLIPRCPRPLWAPPPRHQVLTWTQYKFQTSKASNGQQCMPVTKTDFCTPEKFRK